MPKIVIKPLSVQQPADEYYPDGDMYGDDGEDFNPEAEESVHLPQEPTIRVPKRGRGRPKGSGRLKSSAISRAGSEISAGTSTPRGRGRGRGRGRPRGITIRLPRRTDDDDGDEDPDTDVEMEPNEVEPVYEATASKPKAGPIGGGKPFRKIGDAVYIIDGDEFVTPADPKGDEKIDEWGNLLGGRRFKANTFILPNRHPKRKYMLAIDAARTSGFRDSLYYFRRNALAFKLNATQPEKDYLIGEGNLGGHFRTRSVTLVTARSAYKLHGSKTIFEGKWVTDDYYEDKALQEITERGLKPGDPVGDLPDPNAQSQAARDNALAENSKSERYTVGSGMGIYRAGGPTTIFGGTGYGPFSDGPLNAVRKSLLSRDGVTEENWMMMMALKVHESNDLWSHQRKGAVKPNAALDAERVEQMEIEAIQGRVPDNTGPVGIYEPHTGEVYYRDDTQPTTSRWKVLLDKRVLGGSKAGHDAWGVAWVDTVMEISEPTTTEERLRVIETVNEAIDVDS